MIVGLGIDLCPISRMRQALSRHQGRFGARVFTPSERAYCDGRADPAQHYAARFAAKEALLKALAVPSGLSWHEIEVQQDDGGAPRLCLRGAAAAAAARRLVHKLHVSLTHSADSAAAVVIAEGGT
jgi:holo-[acyl-carrier protein] synthase